MKEIIKILQSMVTNATDDNGNSINVIEADHINQIALAIKAVIEEGMHDNNNHDIVQKIGDYFKELRFNSAHHLGLGDIRLTI